MKVLITGGSGFVGSQIYPGAFLMRTFYLWEARAVDDSAPAAGGGPEVLRMQPDGQRHGAAPVACA